MKDKIKEWLNKNGYPLELYVNKIFKNRKYLDGSSCLYEDIDNGTFREIDSVATRVNFLSSSYEVDMKVIVECKKSTKPFVILINNSKADRRWKHLLGCQPVGEGLMDLGLTVGKAYMYLNQYIDHLKCKIGRFDENVKEGHSVVQAFSDSDTAVYKGLIGLIKAKEYFDTKHIEFIEKNKEEASNYYSFSVPVLVVDGPLVEVQLDELGELNVQETDWGTITIQKPWLSGPEDLINIQIVKKEFFEEFLIELEKLHDLISSDECVFSTLEFIENISPDK